MRTFPCRLAIVALLAGLGLAGCHHESQQKKLATATATPQMAVQNAVKELKAGDFDSLLQHMLPPADYQQLRAEWKAKQQRSLAQISDTDRQHFAEQMKALTAPHAKKKEFAKLKPALDAWDKKYKQRMPMMVGIFRIMIGTKITQSKTMTGKQKSQARDVLGAAANWAQNTDWGNKAKAKKAVGIAVDTARALKVKTLDQAYKLSYEQAMQRYGTLWKGFKQVAAVYGLSVNTILDSVKVKTLSQKGDQAKLQVNYTIFGKPMTSTLDMVRKGKRWYVRDFLKHWRKSQAKLAHASSAARPGSVAPSASTAPASSAAPAASTAPATAASSGQH